MHRTLATTSEDGRPPHHVGLTSFSPRSYTASMLIRKIDRRTWLPIACALWMIAAGCGGKVLQYPEDHERYLRIDKAVEALRQAYVKKDGSAMAALMVPAEPLEQLQREASADFDSYHHIALDFRVERIMIENDDIDVYVHWQGLWKRDAEDPGARHRGHTRLQWVGTKTVLLRGVQGDVPFGMKGRPGAIERTAPPKK